MENCALFNNKKNAGIFFTKQQG